MNLCLLYIELSNRLVKGEVCLIDLALDTAAKESVMTRNRRRVLWPTLLIALLVFSALTFVAFGRLRSATTTVVKINTNQIGGSGVSVKRAAYVRRSNLSPKLVWHLNALGDRLEKPGKERLSVTGTLSRANDSKTEIVAVFEFPDRLRLTMQKGNQSRVITFDGEQTKAGNPLDTEEQDLIETLMYGSAEHFFNTQMQGMATRFLGSRFRLDDGSSPNYDGPYYDVYKVSEQIRTSAEQRERLKLYYFNSETLLLERVSYEIYRNGSAIKVEERLRGWTKEQGQHVARRIERLENGESVFVLTVSTAGLSRRVDDGLFTN